jgi:hypothetical protein
MSRLYRLLLIFAILFAVLLMGPAFFGSPFGPYPLMEQGDVLDLLTPLILIPIYWLLLELAPENPPSRGENLLFLVLAVLWVDGHGMHLAANSVGHLLKDLAGSDVYTLTDFYDEVLSHYLWHFSVVALAVLLLYRQWRHPFSDENKGLVLGIIAGLVYGFVFFAMVVEAQTSPLGVPFALLVPVFALVWGRKEFKRQPVLVFFTIACLLALGFFVGWAIYWRDLPELLPEFSHPVVGIID